MLKIEKAPSANLRIINIESLDISLKEINKLSVTHKFKAPSLQSVKDRWSLVCGKMLLILRQFVVRLCAQ